MAYKLNVGSTVPVGVYGDVAANFLFSSLNPKVATVDASGTVTAVAPGKVPILMMRKSDRAIRRVVMEVLDTVTHASTSVVNASGNPVAAAPFALKVNNKVYGSPNHFKELRAATVPTTPSIPLSLLDNGQFWGEASDWYMNHSMLNPDKPLDPWPTTRWCSNGDATPHDLITAFGNGKVIKKIELQAINDNESDYFMGLGNGHPRRVTVAGWSNTSSSWVTLASNVALADTSDLQTIDLSANTQAVISIRLTFDGGTYGTTEGSNTGYVQISTLKYYVAAAVSLDAPMNLQASQSSMGAPIDLVWDAVSGATRYEVQRKSAYEIDWTSVDNQIVSLSCADGNIGFGVNYEYQVRAIDASGNTSAWSASCFITSMTSYGGGPA